MRQTLGGQRRIRPPKLACINTRSLYVSATECTVAPEDQRGQKVGREKGPSEGQAHPCYPRLWPQKCLLPLQPRAPLETRLASTRSGPPLTWAQPQGSERGAGLPRRQQGPGRGRGGASQMISLKTGWREVRKGTSCKEAGCACRVAVRDCSGRRQAGWGWETHRPGLKLPAASSERHRDSPAAPPAVRPLSLQGLPDESFSPGRLWNAPRFDEGWGLGWGQGRGLRGERRDYLQHHPLPPQCLTLLNTWPP